MLKKIIPDQHIIKAKLQNSRLFSRFAPALEDPDLWHLTLSSAAKATSIGLFISFLPFPGHMLFATLLAIYFKANIPLAIGLVWVSNPLTIPPMFYLSYRVGAFLLRLPTEPFHFQESLHWLLHELDRIGLPLLVGALFCGLISALIGNLIARIVWHLFKDKPSKNQEN